MVQGCRGAAGPRLAGSGAMPDTVATGGRRETDTGPDEPVEGRAQMVPAVPAEDDLVEVALDVLLANAVELAGSQIRPLDGFARQRPPPTLEV